jgi:hypothetical protein
MGFFGPMAPGSGRGGIGGNSNGTRPLGGPLGKKNKRPGYGRPRMAASVTGPRVGRLAEFLEEFFKGLPLALKHMVFVLLGGVLF